MHDKKIFLCLILLLMPLYAMSQIFNEMDASGNITQRDEFGNSTMGNFNPNRRDSAKVEKEIPRGVRVWTVDRLFGDVRPAQVDTMPHMFQNSIHNKGIWKEYNTTGANYAPRQNRIFIDRPKTDEFFFVQPYDYTMRLPNQFLFTNTLSPYTNITYDNCGDKQYGDDHIDAKFAVNANKRLGFGFDLDYHYSRGYFQNQNNANFRASLFASYIGDKYQMHAIYSNYHRKNTESGGITDDAYITHPESFDDTFSEEEIPTVLSKNWNRNNSQHLFFSHRYNIGFYRKVKMTEEEIKARQFAAASAKQKKEREAQQNRSDGRDEDNDDAGRRKGKREKAAEEQPSGRPADAKIAGDAPGAAKGVQQPVDTTRIEINSEAMMDSLQAVQAREDSIDATMKKEYVPVTSFIHTLDINNYERIYQAYSSPAGYYAQRFFINNTGNVYAGDSIYDMYKYTSVKNTFALALLEGFNKYVKAGLKAYISHEYRKFQMPDVNGRDSVSFMNQWNNHCVNIGGQLLKTQGRTLHFNLSAELGLTGYNAGALTVDFNTDLNFNLLGDTLRLAANAWFHRKKPTFFQNTYHSKYLWWEQSLNSETRTHLEGLFTYEKTKTRLRVAIDEIQNYTYFGMNYTTTGTRRTDMTAGVYQSSGNINLLTAQLIQHLRLGILNWENVITYQNSSDNNILPVPTLNVFSNLFLKFRIARVLLVELGGCATYFTKYKAPDYCPQLGQFAVQQNEASRVEIGDYPFVDVYANMHLKRARFFIAMTHVNAGSGNKQYFLTPHYPTYSRVMYMGVSWNFFN
jgi:hypothetical protein